MIASSDNILNLSLIIKNAADLRELVEDLACDVIFVCGLTNRALQKTLQFHFLILEIWLKREDSLSRALLLPKIFEKCWMLKMFKKVNFLTE